jgi:hypothetical protein
LHLTGRHAVTELYRWRQWLVCGPQAPEQRSVTGIPASVHFRGSEDRADSIASLL